MQDDPNNHLAKENNFLNSVAAVGVVYCVAPGPTAYLYCVAENRFGLGGDLLQTSLLLIFYPHLIVAEYFDFYWDYINWCAKLGGGW